jgi:hypothetical protein
MAKKKRNYLPPPRKVRIPDQDEKHTYEVTFDHYVVSPTGKRDKFLERKTVKFSKSNDLADYYEQNCEQSKLRDLNRQNDEGED